MSLTNQIFETPEDALAHYGVKGMKWGVTRDRSGSSLGPGKRSEKTSSKSESSKTSDQNKEVLEKTSRSINYKKVAIGVGVLTVAAGAGYAAYRLNQSGVKPMSSLQKTVDSGKKMTDNILDEPVRVIHATRGKKVGFMFLDDGGLRDPLPFYTKMFGDQQNQLRSGFIKDSAGRIAATFEDPDGRKDYAGRTIPHEVIVPKSMSSGIDTLDDVKTKIWPKLKDSYDEFYKESEKDRS